MLIPGLILDVHCIYVPKTRRLQLQRLAKLTLLFEIYFFKVQNLSNDKHDITYSTTILRTICKTKSQAVLSYIVCNEGRKNVGVAMTSRQITHTSAQVCFRLYCV